MESNHRPTDYESDLYRCGVLLIKHLRRLPISKPVSSSHSLRHSKSGEGAVGFAGLAHASEVAQVLIESRERAFEQRGIRTRVRSLAAEETSGAFAPVSPLNHPDLCTDLCTAALSDGSNGVAFPRGSVTIPTVVARTLAKVA